MVKKYLWQDRHGHWRVRIKGKTWPMRDARGVWLLPETAAFDHLYWQILGGKAQDCATSYAALIASYRQSDRWTRLKPRTRGDYEKVFLYLEERTGSKDVSLTKRKDIIAAQEANRHRTRFANYIPQVMSVLFEHAIDKGWMTENPAKGVRALVTPKERRQEHIPWPDWAVEKFRAEAAPPAPAHLRTRRGQRLAPRRLDSAHVVQLSGRRARPDPGKDRQGPPHSLYTPPQGCARQRTPRGCLHTHPSRRPPAGLPPDGPGHARRTSSVSVSRPMTSTPCATAA